MMKNCFYFTQEKEDKECPDFESLNLTSETQWSNWDGVDIQNEVDVDGEVFWEDDSLLLVNTDVTINRAIQVVGGMTVVFSW